MPAPKSAKPKGQDEKPAKKTEAKKPEPADDGIDDMGEWRIVAWHSDRGHTPGEIKQAMDYDSPLRGAEPGKFTKMPERWCSRELGHHANLRQAAYFRLQEYTALFPQMTSLIRSLAKIFAAECEKEYEFVQYIRKEHPHLEIPFYVDHADSSVPKYPEVYLKWVKAHK